MVSGLTDLPENGFERYDESPDEDFYVQPRLVTHIDEGAIAAVTGLYRELFPPGGDIIDLMSSWVSHLPPEVHYGRVVGQGMNRAELEANPRLTERLAHNLNADPTLPFDEDSFDGAGLCVSVQYLTRPVAVFREAARILRPGAPLVVTFSNRCFPTKAVAIWQALDDEGHIALVRRYFDDAGAWTDVEARTARRGSWRGDPLYAVIGRRAGGDGRR
jgi:SAM-dependent methyltransferase